MGLGLAGIYALGAASAISQLQSADLNALQIVALIPIDQILSRGIGAVTTIFVVAIPIALLTALNIFNFEQLRTRKNATANDQESSCKNNEGETEDEGVISLPFPISGPIGIFLLLAGFLFIPADYLTILVFSGLAMAAAIRVVRNWRLRENRYPWRPAAFLAGYLSFLITASLMTAIVRPSPLPRMDMTLHRGGHIEADFVVLMNSNWYLARPNGDLLAVPTENVEKTTISYGEPESSDSIFESILDD